MLRLIVAVLCVIVLTASGDIVYPYDDDLSYAVDYIESGHDDIYSGYYAYDNTATYWRSDLSGAACNGVCWVGQDFGDPVVVTHIGFIGYGYVSSSAESVDVLYSDDCSDYTLVDTYTLPLSGEEVFLFITEQDPHQCWIVMANTMSYTGKWIIVEMQMFNDPSLQTTIIGTLESGEVYQVDRYATFGDMSIGLLLSLIAVILTAILFVSVAYGKRNQRNS